METGPKSEPEPMHIFPSHLWGIIANYFQWSQVCDFVKSDSELSIDDFEVPVNSQAFRQNPFPIMEMHIFTFLSS